MGVDPAKLFEQAALDRGRGMVELAAQPGSEELMKKQFGVQRWVPDVPTGEALCASPATPGQTSEVWWAVTTGGGRHLRTRRVAKLDFRLVPEMTVRTA